MTKEELAKMIDHTYLKIDGGDNAIGRVCLEAIRYGFGAVAVLPVAVPLASKWLKGTGVNVCAALSFFRGRYPLEIKIAEVRDAIDNGATELDMVMSVDLLKAGKYDLLEREFREFARVANGLTTKVILETCLLTDEEIVTACEIAKASGVDFVKTSTGLKGGATTHAVALMRETVGPEMGVKASGGIRTWEQAKAMIEAGANRLGTSSGVQILESFLQAEGGDNT